MSTSTPPLVDADRASSTSSVSSSSSTDSLAVGASTPVRKKSFLSSLFHSRKDDQPPSPNKADTTTDKPASEAATASAVAAPAPMSPSISTPATDRQSSTGSNSSTASISPTATAPPSNAPTAAAASASDAYSAFAHGDTTSTSVPSAQVLTIAQLISGSSPTAASDATPAASPVSATSATAVSATSTPTSVSAGTRSAFFTPTVIDARESEVKTADTAVGSGETVVLVETSQEQPAAEGRLQPLTSRSRSNSDASALDIKTSSITPTNSSTVSISKSHTDLSGIAGAPSTSPTDSGTPSSRRRTLLNTLFKRKVGDEPQTPAAHDTPSNSNKQQETVDSEQLTAIVVEAEQTRDAAQRVEAQTEKTASAMENLKRVLDEGEAANGSRQRANSDADGGKPARLSSRASMVNKGDTDEQPKSARAEKRSTLGGFFSSLRLGKHKSEEQLEQKENETEPEAASTASTSSSSSSTTSTSTSSTLDYKARMQQLIEKRGGGDRRRSMSDAHRSTSDNSLSQPSGGSRLKAASAEVNDTMGENNAIAARNLNQLQQMENRAAEMEDAADSMLARAKKIKEDAKRKSLFGW